MITLYSMPGACSVAAHIALIWANLPYQVKIISREDLTSAAYHKINPIGAIPAISEEGWVLTQNIAILEYIADKAAERANIGASTDLRDRAEFHSWLGFLTSDLHKAMSPIFRPSRFCADENLADATRTLAVQHLQSLLKTADNRLENTLYCHGNRKTVVDAYLFVILTWVIEKANGIIAYPNLSAFYHNMYLDQGVQQAAKEEGFSYPLGT